MGDDRLKGMGEQAPSGEGEGKLRPELASIVRELAPLFSDEDGDQGSALALAPVLEAYRSKVHSAPFPAHLDAPILALAAEEAQRRQGLLSRLFAWLATPVHKQALGMAVSFGIVVVAVFGVRTLSHLPSGTKAKQPDAAHSATSDKMVAEKAVSPKRHLTQDARNRRKHKKGQLEVATSEETQNLPPDRAADQPPMLPAPSERDEGSEVTRGGYLSAYDPSSLSLSKPNVDGLRDQPNAPAAVPQQKPPAPSTIVPTPGQPAGSKGRGRLSLSEAYALAQQGRCRQAEPTLAREASSTQPEARHKALLALARCAALAGKRTQARILLSRLESEAPQYRSQAQALKRQMSRRAKRGKQLPAKK